MRVLIVDDEPLARERLRRQCTEIGDLQVVGEAGDGRQALAVQEAEGAELVLLDIRMPVMDGLEAARHLAQLQSPPAVVFTTAYGDHALAAFEAEAIDYLLKPIRRERLEQAVARARRLGARQLEGLAAVSECRRQLSSYEHGQLLLIPFESVWFFRAEQKYVEVWHEGGVSLIDDSLKQLEEEYGDELLRVHRNALVVPGAVAGLEKGADGRFYLSLKTCEERLEISRRHLPELRQRIREGRL